MWASSALSLQGLFTGILCHKQVKHTIRRHLGLRMHPTVELFIFLPLVKPTLALSFHSLNGWVLLYYRCYHPHFFSLGKMLKINESWYSDRDLIPVSISAFKNLLVMCTQPCHSPATSVLRQHVPLSPRQQNRIRHCQCGGSLNPGSLLCGPDENVFHQTLCQHRPEAGVQLSFRNQARERTLDSLLDAQVNEKC